MKLSKSFWVVKCREKLVNGDEGWNWSNYLDDNTKSQNNIVRKWGGPDWIKSHLSRKFIRERFRKDDLVLCYQVEGRRILGFTRLASNGLKVDGIYSAFDLAPSTTAYVLKQPLSIEQLRATGCNPNAFNKKLRLRGTVLELFDGEMRGVVAAVLAHSPDEEEDFLSWLKAAGFGDGSRPTVKHLGNAEFHEENTALNENKIERELHALEKKFKGHDDVYIVRKVNAIIRRDGPLIN